VKSHEAQVRNQNDAGLGRHALILAAWVLNPSGFGVAYTLGVPYRRDRRNSEPVRELERTVVLAPSMRRADITLGRFDEALVRKAEPEKAHRRRQSQ